MRPARCGWALLTGCEAFLLLIKAVIAIGDRRLYLQSPK